MVTKKEQDATDEDSGVHEWREELKRALFLLSLDDPIPSLSPEGVVVECGVRLRSVAYMLAGIGCAQCYGTGERVYPNTTGWRGGAGGQAITDGVCDSCWGTGRTDRKGADLRRISSMISDLERRLLAQKKRGDRLHSAVKEQWKDRLSDDASRQNYVVVERAAAQKPNTSGAGFRQNQQSKNKKEALTLPVTSTSYESTGTHFAKRTRTSDDDG